MRNTLLGVASAVVVAGVTLLPAAPAPAVAKTVAPKAGQSCTAAQLGTVVVASGRRLVCARSGSKRVWTPVTEPPATAAPTTVAAPVPSVVFRDDFSNIYGGWFTGPTAYGESGYRDEKYQILVRRPANAAANVPYGVFSRAPGLSNLTNIAIDVDVLRRSEGGAFGVACYDNATPVNRYEGIVGFDDRWSITEIRDGKSTVLGAGELQLNVLGRGTAPNSLRMVCTGAPGGPGRIVLVLNGQTIADRPVASMPPGGAVAIWAYAHAGVSGVQMVFNNIVVTRV